MTLFPRAGSLKRGVAVLVLSVLSSLTWAANQPDAGKSRPTPPKLDSAIAGSDFAIEKSPNWVQAVAANPPAGLAPSSIQVLLVDRQTRIDATGVTRYMHFVRQVNDSPGLQNAAQIAIEFDPSYQKLAWHQLAVWRGNQRIDKLDRKRIKLLHRETQLERQVVDGRMTASIVLDDLRVGDRIEWAASLVGSNPVFASRFVDIEWTQSDTGPIADFQLRVSAPADRNIRYRVNDPAITSDTLVRGAWREWVFRGQNLVQFRYDPLLPPGEYLKSQIEFSEFADWAEVAAWAEQLFAKATQASAAIDARVAEIRSTYSEPDDQLRATLDFVQQDVRYFGTEIGADSHQPASADTVLRQRFGDCKDKIALLATLLRRLGFETTPLLVSTQYGGQVRERLPSPLAFNHVIAGVKVKEQVLWLDGTRAQQSGAASTRQPVGLGHGLLARGSGEVLQALPTTQGTLRTETVDTFGFPQLAKEGSLESVTTYHGELSEWLLDAKANLSADDFEKLVGGDMLRAYPSLTLTGAPEITPVAGRNAVKVTLRYRTGSFWKFPEQRALVGNMALMGLVLPLRLPDQTPRVQPLRIGTSGRYLHTVKFAFGEPVFTQPSSTRFDESNPRFDLHIRYSGQASEQVIEGELDQRAERIEAADWTAYRDQLNKMWPRLGSAIAVPAVTPQQAEALRTELAALDASMRRGDVRVVTREQANAKARLLVLDQRLAAGRLPENLRAETLVARGMQLDHLGRADEAKVSLEEAVALDQHGAAARAALAVNAFARRADAVAIEQADAALRLAPSDIAPRYTRAWAHYFAGDFAKSQSELKDILQSRSEVERSYGAIWLYLATRRQGGDGAAAIRAYMPTGSKPDWPHSVLQWLSGSAEFDAAMAATRDGGQASRGRECELYFFAAQKALLDADLRQARFFLQKSLNTGVVEFTEYTMAKRELDRLGAR